MLDFLLNWTINSLSSNKTFGHCKTFNSSFIEEEESFKELAYKITMQWDTEIPRKLIKSLLLLNDYDENSYVYIYLRLWSKIIPELRQTEPSINVRRESV